jgi:hypothetical protein
MKKINIYLSKYNSNKGYDDHYTIEGRFIPRYLPVGLTHKEFNGYDLVFIDIDGNLVKYNLESVDEKGKSSFESRYNDFIVLLETQYLTYTIKLEELKKTYPGDFGYIPEKGKYD